jgi:hypothetical protein
VKNGKETDMGLARGIKYNVINIESGMRELTKYSQAQVETANNNIDKGKQEKIIIYRDFLNNKIK